MATIFPSSPTVGQVYQGYEWNGTAWIIIGIDLTQDYATQTELNNHESDTTNVHGIANTAVLATQTYVDTAASTAVANLIDSAPSTLDTLNELAAALGDDPNFATTIASNISTKAPLDSPSFTGTPTSITATADTNTTQIATTQFVIGQASSQSPLVAGTASSGSSLKYSRSDHIHPSEIPSQTSNSGKYLYTNGSSISWSDPTITSINAQASSYILQLSDVGKMIEINNASASNLTVPLNSSVSFPIGTTITILQTGAGQITLVATGGVTINSNPGLKLRGQWSSATLVKRSTDTWVAMGDLTA